MLKDGLKPNIFVYNSMMNVNVGDLDEVQRYYRHMQVAILNSVIICKFFYFRLYYIQFVNRAIMTPHMERTRGEGSCFELFREGENLMWKAGCRNYS